MNATRAFPQAEPSDPDSVIDALDAGLLHWAKGETDEALRCLRQAHAAADEAGNDQRALALARTAAELLSPASSTPEPAKKKPDSAMAAAPKAQATGTTEPSPVEPQRSRLPGPPTTPKKFTGAADSAENRGDAKPGSASVTPTPATATPLSVRPAAPSTRPVSVPSTAAVGSGSLAPASSPRATSSPIKSTVTPGAAAQGVSFKPAIGPIESTKPTAINGAQLTHRRVDGQPAILAQSDTLARVAQAAHPSQRPEGQDHRLASLRVRIERIEADGTVRLRLVESTTAIGGADNALLVVSEAVWRALKPKDS